MSDQELSAEDVDMLVLRVQGGVATVTDGLQLGQHIAAITTQRDEAQEALALFCDDQCLCTKHWYIVPQTCRYCALEKAEAERDEASAWIRVVGEEMVIAGFPAGDRTVQLANIRQMIKAVRELAKALADVLNRFPRPDVVEDFKADCGYGHRQYGIELADDQLVKLRAVLTKFGPKEEQ